MATSRKDIRKAIAADLATALEGAGKPAQKVYDHLPEKLEGSPCLCVVSAGTKTNRSGIGSTNAKNTFRFALMIFQVVPTDLNGWTMAAAQDAQDDLEQAARDWVVKHPSKTGAWKYLAFVNAGQQDGGQFTDITAVKIAGIEYDLETLLVEVEAYDS